MSEDIFEQMDKLVEENNKKPKSDFPVDVFPQPIQSYILDCNTTLDSNIDYMGSTLLWGISTVIGNSSALQLKNGWLEYCSLWIACVGRAGVGKTPSMSMAARPFKKINTQMIKSYPKKHKAWEDNPGDTEEPKLEQMIVNDTTIEALVYLHSKNLNAIGMYRDELDAWVKNMARYSNGSDMPFWLAAWSGEDSSSNRKSGDNFLDKPFVPIIGGVQPAILETFSTDENKSNGFLDRILLCCPEINVEFYNPNEMNSTAIEWYDDYVLRFHRTIKMNIRIDENEEIIPIRYKFDVEAHAEFEKCFNTIVIMQNSDEENEYMKSMLPKQKNYILRFSLILHLMHNIDCVVIPVLISRDIVLKAWKLSEYFISQAKKVKVNASETASIKDLLIKHKDLSPKERFKMIYERGGKLNHSKIAEELNVSRKSLFNWTKEFNDKKNEV